MKEFHDIIIGIVVYIIVPFLGLAYYLFLRKRMINDNIIQPPIWSMFIMFFTYGGLLTLIFTVFFWEWSAGASIGVFYLLFLAPILMLLIAYKQYKKRKTSIYHKWMFYLGTSYFIIAPLVFIIALRFSKN
jgi:hypothetical protein